MRRRGYRLLISRSHGSFTQTHLLLHSSHGSFPIHHPNSSHSKTSKQSKQVSFQAYSRMLQECYLPNESTLLSLFSSFSGSTDMVYGKFLHSLAMEGDLNSHVILGNAIISMYGRCDPSTSCSRIAFNGLNVKNVASWNAFISVLIQHGKYSQEAFQMFEQMKQEGAMANTITFVVILHMCANHTILRVGLHVHAYLTGLDAADVDVMVNTALIDMYGKCGCIKDAELMFQVMPERNVITWNTMISAYARSGKACHAGFLFSHMLKESIMPTDVTFLNVISAFSSSSQEESMWRGKQIHARIVKSLTLNSNISLGNALIGMYRRFGNLMEAHHAFYTMPRHDLVSWNAMISSYSYYHKVDEVFQLFSDMQSRGIVVPNKTTFSSILSTCASRTALLKGIQMHALVIISGLHTDLLVCNALISMYGKCGDLIKAQEVFDGMHEHNTVSWNAIFDVYALHGEAKNIEKLYKKMQSNQALPDLITFTSILTMCSRLAMVNEACDFLRSMYQDYGLMPTCDHFNCVIDLLGRTGKLDEAENVLNSMPIPYGTVSIRALLSACRYRSDLERGERAAKHVIVLDPNNTGPYTMLTNLYGVVN